MQVLVRSFSYTPRAGFSEELLWYSFTGFSEEFLLHSWSLLIARISPYTTDASFCEEVPFDSSRHF